MSFKSGQPTTYVDLSGAAVLQVNPFESTYMFLFFACFFVWQRSIKCTSHFQFSNFTLSTSSLVFTQDIVLCTTCAPASTLARTYQKTSKMYQCLCLSAALLRATKRARLPPRSGTCQNPKCRHVMSAGLFARLLCIMSAQCIQKELAGTTL
jgi:hypothetical protein